MQQAAFKGRFEGGEELLPLIGPLQAELQIFNGRFGFWEIWVDRNYLISN